jgi:hypothetical protein
MLAGANAFEISDIQEDESEAALAGRSDVSKCYIGSRMAEWSFREAQPEATGDVIVVRYADDLVVGFENRTEAERFLEAFRERLLSSDWNYIRRKHD